MRLFLFLQLPLLLGLSMSIYYLKDSSIKNNKQIFELENFVESQIENKLKFFKENLRNLPYSIYSLQNTTKTRNSFCDSWINEYKRLELLSQNKLSLESVIYLCRAYQKLFEDSELILNKTKEGVNSVHISKLNSLLLTSTPEYTIISDKEKFVTKISLHAPFHSSRHNTKWYINNKRADLELNKTLVYQEKQSIRGQKEMEVRCEISNPITNQIKRYTSKVTLNVQ